MRACTLDEVRVLVCSFLLMSDLICRIESASYYLANPSSAGTPYADEFQRAIDKLIGEMEAFQHADGYLNVYFTVVDPAGKFQNLRDMHEMCEYHVHLLAPTSPVGVLLWFANYGFPRLADNAGHLLEGAIAHYRLTGSRRFLDIMIKVSGVSWTTSRPFAFDGARLWCRPSPSAGTWKTLC